MTKETINKIESRFGIKNIAKEIKDDIQYEGNR